MDKKPKWKIFAYYTLAVVLALFLALNRQGVEPNLIFFTMPKLPLALWLFIMLMAGFFLGRAFPKKKKIK